MISTKLNEIIISCQQGMVTIFTVRNEVVARLCFTPVCQSFLSQGVSALVHVWIPPFSRYTPQAGTPPWASTPHWAGTPHGAGAPILGRLHPLHVHFPGRVSSVRYTPWADTPLIGTPPWASNPPPVGTPSPDGHCILLECFLLCRYICPELVKKTYFLLVSYPIP